MATEAERFLRKARESLASAEADIEAGRHNSAANRAYYAAFQAGIAALSHSAIRPDRGWDHKFVNSQFSGKLIWRRKVFSAGLADMLTTLFEVRVSADYRPDDVPARTATRSVNRAATLISDVTEFLKPTMRESRTEYGEEMATRISTREKSLDYVEEVRGLINARFPSAEFEVVEFGPKDFRLIVWVDGEDATIEVSESTAVRRTEILVKTGVWVVVLALDRTQRDN